MAVHTILPPSLTDAVDELLRAAGVGHVAHGDDDPVGAAVAAASDPRARAVIGPFRSADVSEALAATAPARLPLLTPVATWAGVTRDDEPGCDDAPRHDGTVLRMVAGDYGLQLDGQLALAYAPGPVGVAEARRAAEIVVAARDLEEMRRLGPFDEHGDPVDPLVRFERYDA
jgi:hypothetical protein